MWAALPLLVMLSLFSQTHSGPGRDPCGIFSYEDYDCYDNDHNFDDEIKFWGLFTIAFVRLDVPREGLAMWLKRFSLSLQKQIQHSQLMSGDSHIKALGEFKIGEMKSK